MKIDGFEITRVSELDRLPIKNHLPAELQKRLKTEKQWLDEGFLIKDDAVRYKMHPSVLAKKTVCYYLDNDVIFTAKNEVSECCRTCAVKSGRFCMVAGDFVLDTNYCSEWQSKSR